MRSFSHFHCCLLVIAFGVLSSVAVAQHGASENFSDTPALPSKEAAEKDAKLSPEQIGRKKAIERCLSIYFTRQVDADVLRPWSIMHGLIGFGDQTLILTQGKRVNAVQYLCANGIGDDRRLLYAIDGKLRTNVGRGYQGHEGQLLAMLAQANVSPDLPITVDGKTYTVADLIRYEMESCKSQTELTFKLLGLSHYLDSDAAWTAQDGQAWNFARLLQEELNSKIDETTACGGTHRLMAVSRAIKNRKEQGKAFDGNWKSAQKYVDDFREFAFGFQGPDGSFSSQWFRTKEFSGDQNRRLYTTGHVLEWLVYDAETNELLDPRISKAVDFVVNLMLNAPGYDLDVGPRGHALHALRIYEKRVFGASNHQQLMGSKFARQIEIQNRQIRQATRQQQSSPTDSDSVPISPFRRRGILGFRR